MNVAETPRLRLRRLKPRDADFILQLLNEPGWMRYIGDRGVRTREDALRYIAAGPVDMYARLGFGLYRVELKSDATPIGLCGPLKRDTLDHADLGFAMLGKFQGLGYTLEAAEAVLRHAATELALRRLLAITKPENAASIRVLEKLGFGFDRLLPATDQSPELRLYSIAIS